MVFESALPLGAGTLHIAYTGILNGDMAGFYRSFVLFLFYFGFVLTSFESFDMLDLTILMPMVTRKLWPVLNLSHWMPGGKIAKLLF